MRSSAIVLFAIVAATIAILVPVVFLKSGPSSNTQNGQSPAGNVDIAFTVWGMPFEDRLFEDGYARGFETANPGVRVQYQRFDGDQLNMKYKAWHAAGTGAEVMRVMVTDYHQMATSGMLEPLDQYIDAPGSGLTSDQLNAFPPHLIESLRIDGKLYALPEDNAQYGLFYNKTIIDKYNDEHSDDPVPYPDDTWTWEDLRKNAAKLSKHDENGDALIHGFDISIWQWPFMNFFAQAGGELWTDDGLTTLINTQPGVDALNFFGGLVADGSWSPYFGRAQGTGPDSRFLNGKTALYMDGSWMVPNIENRNPDLNFAVAPAPRGKEIAVVCGSCLWGIGAKAKQKQTGWEMIRWLVSEEQAAAYWDTLRVAPPAHMAVINSKRFQTTRGIPKAGADGEYEVQPMPAERYQDRAAWLEYAMSPHPETGKAPGFVPTSLYQRKLEDEIRVVLNDYLRDPANVDPQTVLDTAAKAIHAEIDRDRAAKGLEPVAR